MEFELTKTPTAVTGLSEAITYRVQNQSLRAVKLRVQDDEDSKGNTVPAPAATAAGRILDRKTDTQTPETTITVGADQTLYAWLIGAGDGETGGVWIDQRP